ncbi:bcl-2-like protein 15 [Pseudonaja textilis]|uniref:bcl-2-like protein 15 n=1 Tax=Pseudonaja textilis TaxID=8673 RepID=UPI000EA91214|nr:bcl-2-like protein 15 [Pseudonaja textilis]
MNNSVTFEEQTERIVEALFTKFCSKKSQVTGRCLQLQSEIKAHEQGSASSFNPVDIADSLKSLGDKYNAEIESHVQAVIAEESIRKIKKFGEVTESLSRNWISQTPGLEPERVFLAAAVKLFVKFMKKTGDKGQINILTETINGNPELRGYIERQGGWGNLGRSLNSP